MTLDLVIKADVMEECCRAWLRSLRTDGTRVSYQAGLDNLVASAGKPLGEIGKGDVGLWIDEMRSRKLAESTIQLRLRCANSFYKFAIEEWSTSTGVVNPVNYKIFRRKIARYSKSRFLSVEDVKRLLAVVPGTVIGLRDYALLLGYVVLGRRNSEWRTARVCDFEDGQGIVFRWSGKGHEGERIGVSAEVWGALQRYVEASGGRGGYDYIFLSRQGRELGSRRVEQIVARYARMAGIRGRLRVHDLRHTAAMLWRQAGADVEELREFLGHSSLDTTQIYLHRMEGVSKKRADEVINLLNLGQK